MKQNISGKLLQAQPYIDKEIKRLSNMVKDLNITPTLVIVKVGNDRASERYVKNKVNMGKKVGITTIVQQFDEHTQEQELIDYIKYVNTNDDIHGCLVQLPLPNHINETNILNALDPKKDVDGFHSQHLGKLVKGEDCIVSCTPKGIIDLLDFYDIDIEGKKVVILNRSNIVGKPLIHLMLQRNATVCVCHSKTSYSVRMNEIMTADIIITAVGKPKFLRYWNIPFGKTIVDVSINVDEDGKLCGDLDKDCYEDLIREGCNITPVPGGIGPMTVLSLMKNVIKACLLNIK